MRNSGLPGVAIGNAGSLGSITGAAVITPADGDPIDPPVRGFHANEDGTVVVIFENSDTAVTLTVKAGAYYPYMIRELQETSTAEIVGLARATS